MHSYSHRYLNEASLAQFIANNNLCEHEAVLIQVFTGINEYEYIEKLRQTLVALVPRAKIIGATTAGEIMGETTTVNSSVINFTLFEKTHLETHLISSFENSFELGTSFLPFMTQSPHYKSLKLILTFTDGLHTNAEEYLKGINSINHSITIAGGMAGDNSLFQNTYIFNEHTVSNKGAVMALFYNKNLEIHTDFNFSWQCLGKSHIVEKADKNRVYTIGGKTAVDFYAHYLGENIAAMLPAIGIEFPLIIKQEGIDMARAVINKYDDGSLGFAGNVPQGSTIKIGYGDIQMILSHGAHKAQQLGRKPIEAIFIYSCMARKFLLKDEINNELKPLHAIAPTCGFFTYGEFFYAKPKTLLFNQTMTILALSESSLCVKKEPKCNSLPLEYDKQLDSYRIQALSTLIGRTTQELEALNIKLEQRVDEEIKNGLEKDVILYANARHAQMGEILDMIVHQWRQPLNVFSAGVSSLQLYNHMGLLTKDVLEQTTQQILKNVEFLNNTIKDFRNFFKNSQHKEYTNIHMVVEISLTLMEPLIKKFGIRISKEISLEKELCICTSQLIQVMLNIFKNAIDAIEEKKIKAPEIICRVYEKNAQCLLEVSDNAGGIAPDVLPHIFEKRFTTKDDTHGTGIGLNMSKTLIETHFNGTMHAFNNALGATFIVSFPLATSLEL